MRNSELITDIEAKLFQIESMARIALDNHNYKNSGYNEPFINNADMSNLMWAITDLAHDAYSKVQALELNKERSHA